MLCYKISENPRKGFLQLLDRGMNKKRIYFRTLRHSSFLLPSVMEFFTEKAIFWDTLLSSVQTIIHVYTTVHVFTWKVTFYQAPEKKPSCIASHPVLKYQETGQESIGLDASIFGGNIKLVEVTTRQYPDQQQHKNIQTTGMARRKKISASH